MCALYWRGWSPDTPCAEYAKLKGVAEELVTSLSGAASLEMFSEAQKSLLFLFQELHQRIDPMHYRTPGGHKCLQHCYLEYATRIRNKAILFQPAPQEQPAPPSPEPLRTPKDVVKAAGDTLQPNQDELPIGVDDESIHLEGYQ
jgi:hypothetical protein